MTKHTLGERLFSRYAYSPNELGYCGPAGAAGLAAVARGEEADFQVRPVAAQFSGAWVYQVIVARMLGLDALDAEVVRGYWTGNDAVAGLDRDEFWRQLIAVIGPRAGAYWKHLDDALAVEAAPSHAFHVLGVYPWSRLLATGRPEPVDVLQSCCIRPARVVSVESGSSGAAGAGSAGVLPGGAGARTLPGSTGTPKASAATKAFGTLTVETGNFRYRQGRLVRETVTQAGVTALFDPDIAVGDLVALHWGAACDRLTEVEASTLSTQLDTQFKRLNERLARESAT